MLADGTAQLQLQPVKKSRTNNLVRLFVCIKQMVVFFSSSPHRNELENETNIQNHYTDHDFCFAAIFLRRCQKAGSICFIDLFCRGRERRQATIYHTKMLTLTKECGINLVELTFLSGQALDTALQVWYPTIQHSAGSNTVQWVWRPGSAVYRPNRRTNRTKSAKISI